jgi:hypothetical protein
MGALLGEVDNVGATDVEFAEDGIGIAENQAQVFRLDVDPQKSSQCAIGIRVPRHGAGAHGDLPVNEFQSDAGRIFPEHQVLAGGHFSSANNGHLHAFNITFD